MPLGDYYSYSDVIVHCTVIQLAMMLAVGDISLYDFELRKQNCKSVLTYFLVFLFQYADDLT